MNDSPVNLIFSWIDDALNRTITQFHRFITQNNFTIAPNCEKKLNDNSVTV